MENIIQTIQLNYQEWENNKERQKSGYLYEKTFVEMWQSLGNEVFQKSVGKMPTDKNLKKNFKPHWVK
jgi:hypothetical protein